MQVKSALDVNGAPSDKVLLFAYLNAFYETGFKNPIDDAIRAYRPVDLTDYRKQDEIPYDFLRKRLSIVVTHGDSHLMVTKGALTNILEVCSFAETQEGRIVQIAAVQDQIQKNFAEFSQQGFRTLGLAYKNMPSESAITKTDDYLRSGQLGIRLPDLRPAFARPSCPGGSVPDRLVFRIGCFSLINCASVVSLVT